MNRRVVLIMSLGLALAAVFLLQTWRHQLLAESGIAGEQVRVVSARTDIGAHSVLEAHMLEWRSYPPGFLPPRAITEEFAADIIGMTVQYSIPADQPVLQTDLAASSLGTDLSHIVPDGFRALSIPVDSQSTFGGLLQPRDHVDILGTFNRPRDQEVNTITLLQNVVVLAVGNQLGSSSSPSGDIGRPGRAGVVTILVTPEEAELLIFAQDRGQISMTLRSVEDVSAHLALAGKDFTSIFEPSVRVDIQQRHPAPPGPTIIGPMGGGPRR